MKIERTKNASRNIMFGFLLKIYQILVPFLLRTAMIYQIGIDYVGLNSLFSSILQVLNLTELGVGSAMVYSMYQPIAEDDTESICALMKLYKKYYSIIGWAVLALGLLLVPFLPVIVNKDVPPDINIYVLYGGYLGATVCSYWLYAYKTSLFNAHQRSDIISKVNFVTTSIMYLLQFLSLMLAKSYYCYVFVLLFSGIATNLITAVIAGRVYPQYRPEGELPKERMKGINRRIRDLFTAKLGGVIVNSADSIVITAFLGLKILGIYNNYFYIFSSVAGFFDIISAACMAGIGNSIIVESKEKNYRDLNRLTFFIMWLNTFCICCMCCLYQHFMLIWVKKEALLLDFQIVVCLCVYFFVKEINMILNLYKDAAGIWHQDRFRPLVTALSNLGMNLIMVQFWGLYGVILSTVLSTVVIGMPWLLHNLFSLLFRRSCLPYVMKLFKYALTGVMVTAITYFVCSLLPGRQIFWMIIKLIICCFCSNSLLFLILHNDCEFAGAKELVMKIVKKVI